MVSYRRAFVPRKSPRTSASWPRPLTRWSKFRWRKACASSLRRSTHWVTASPGCTWARMLMCAFKKPPWNWGAKSRSWSWLLSRWVHPGVVRSGFPAKQQRQFPPTVHVRPPELCGAFGGWGRPVLVPHARLQLARQLHLSARLRSAHPAAQPFARLPVRVRERAVPPVAPSASLLPVRGALLQAGEAAAHHRAGVGPSAHHTDVSCELLKYLFIHTNSCWYSDHGKETSSCRLQPTTPQGSSTLPPALKSAVDLVTSDPAILRMVEGPSRSDYSGAALTHSGRGKKTFRFVDFSACCFLVWGLRTAYSTPFTSEGDANYSLKALQIVMGWGWGIVCILVGPSMQMACRWRWQFGSAQLASCHLAAVNVNISSAVLYF